MPLYIDIETIPVQRPDLAAFVAGQVKPPATITKPESIEKWHVESKQKAIEDALNRTSFDGAFGEIACICAAIDDGQVHQFWRNDKRSEKQVIVDFADWLMDHRNKLDTIVGFNHINFDLPFLWKRAVINGTRLPYMPRSVKPWDKNVYDVMHQWDSRNFISLASLAAALGIKSNNEFTGADVYPLWQAGQFDEIANYCADDVELTRQVYRCMNFRLAQA